MPKEICKLSSLTELRLSYNQITAIPKEIGKLSSLKYLYLSDNQITAIPKEIEKLLSLTELRLSYNQITVLPEGFWEVVQARLIKTNLSGNPYIKFSDRIGTLDSNE